MAFCLLSVMLRRLLGHDLGTWDSGIVHSNDPGLAPRVVHWGHLVAAGQT